jgi:hypothetical protein
VSICVPPPRYRQSAQFAGLDRDHDPAEEEEHKEEQ